MKTQLIHIVGYSGAGKTTAMIRLAKKIKEKGGTQKTFHAGNTRRDFKKQCIPIIATDDHTVAWIGQDPVDMKSHRKRFAGTESLAMFQKGMVHRILEAANDAKYKNVIIDGFSILKPGPRQTLKRLQQHKKMKYHVIHLKTPFKVASKSWWSRERQAAKKGHKNAVNAVTKNAGRSEKAKHDEMNDKISIFIDMADEVTEVTRDTIDNVLEGFIW